MAESLPGDRQVKHLLDTIYQYYGYDFSEYAEASCKRRIAGMLENRRFSSIEECEKYIIADTTCFREVLNDLTITVSELFRDPYVYTQIKALVIPFLRTYPRFKIWHAGCAGGEEVYSMAILLNLLGLEQRALIYATDINNKALAYARNGLLSKEAVSLGKRNYGEMGGSESLDRYFREGEDYAIVRPELRHNILFSEHNLVTDYAFGKMQLVFCRNVLIYFNKSLQERVLQMLARSVCPGGFLCLGSRETLQFSKIGREFKCLDKQARIYQKTGSEQ